MWWRQCQPGCGLVFLVLTLLSADDTESADCDRVFQSTADGPKNGTFTSPNWPESYQNNLCCIYKFIGIGQERVQLTFDQFDIQGIPPKCQHDYVDLFIRAEHPDVNLLDTPFLGRYCGSSAQVLPGNLVSMGQIFILMLNTDAAKAGKGFLGTYHFLNSSLYDMGTPAPQPVCGYNIDGLNRPKGIIAAPTYPGIYPDHLFCFYKLQGIQGQRIRLHFLDFDVYEGGLHCPIDHVKVYDGYTNQDLLIGTFCGSVMKDRVLYSTGPALHIEFVTRSGRVPPTDSSYLPYWELEESSRFQQKGFKAEYEFSDKFVNLDFIKPPAMHYPGTECDQVIRSSGQSNGTVTSPYFPKSYPINVTCYFYIDGLEDDKDLEKVRLTFNNFYIPSRSTERCTDGFLAVYLQGRLPVDGRTDDADAIYCGRVPDSPIVSSHPRMFLVFDSHHAGIAGSGFKATYEFLTDYAVPGTPMSEEGCRFQYNTHSQKSGTFTSPRYPRKYPPNMQCIYIFRGLRNEQIRISFDKFLLKASDGISNTECPEDKVIIYEITYDRDTGNETLTNIGVYCKAIIPGPILSPRGINNMMVEFQSDFEGVAGGFQGKYEFLELTDPTCGGNLTSDEHGGGVITSPNYPANYKKDTGCIWHIHLRDPQSKVLLHLQKFAMEGSPSAGCSAAVLRIYKGGGSQPEELCGTDLKPETKMIISAQNNITLKFTTSSSAIGNGGFYIAWAEIIPEVYLGYCSGFKCHANQYCIPRNLVCDKVTHCGEGDTSDEGISCDACRLLSFLSWFLFWIPFVHTVFRTVGAVS